MDEVSNAGLVNDNFQYAGELMKYIIPFQKSIGKHNEMPDSTFDSEQLKMGIKVEMEHTNDKKIAKKIAKDHLVETPDYYTRLKKMENRSKKELHKAQKPLPPGLLEPLPKNIKVDTNKPMKLKHLKALHSKGKIHMAAGLGSPDFPYSQADTLRWMQEQGKHKGLPKGKVVHAVDEEGRKWSAGYFHKSINPVPIIIL